MPRLALPLALAGTFASLWQAADAAATRIAFLDSFATARGNAFTATADNPAAVFYNGAGLTQLEGTQVHGNAFAISLAYEFDGPAGSGEMDDAFQPVPSAFAAHRFEGLPLALGFGIYAPFALGTDWGDEAPFLINPLVPYEAELAYLKYHAVLAWEINETLSVAAGLSYDRAGIDVKAPVLEFNGDDEAIGYSFSVLWQPDPRHSFGLNYQGKTDTTLEGTADLLGFGSLDAKADLPFPESIILGYAYTPNERWSFEVNADWTNWDRVNTLSLDGVPGAAYELEWESAFIWEAGFTHYLDDGWYLSGGYTFVENAVPDETFLPIVPDSDRHFFAAGIGRQYEYLSWQLTLQQAIAADREVSGNQYGTVDGEWDLDSSAISFSLGLRF